MKERIAVLAQNQENDEDSDMEQNYQQNNKRVETLVADDEDLDH